MRLSPAPVSVKTAATEQKDKNNDDQQEFHNFLQNLRFGLFRCNGRRGHVLRTHMAIILEHTRIVIKIYFVSPQVIRNDFAMAVCSLGQH
jgi:hypothetical protein